MARVRVVVLSVAALLLLVVLAACSTSGPKGSLQVTVNGLPGGVNGNVLVTGPGGYSTTVTTTATLPNLTPGNYTVTGKPARGPGFSSNTLVDTAYAATGGGLVAVSGNATANSSVTYALRAGSGGLWVADEGGGLLGVLFTSPATPVLLTSSHGPDGLALDANGNLWVGLTGNTTVAEFPASKLGSSSTPTPVVTVSSDGTSLADPISLAFDAKGDLWVANCTTDLEMYAPAQLTVSGNPSPTVTITGSYSCVSGLAFDASGNLWFSDTNDNDVVELSASQLASSGNPSPHVTLSSSTLNFPEGLAFDANGDLWVANTGSTGVNALVMFTPSEISTSGSPTPSVGISDDGSGNLDAPVYLAFDNAGDLWVADDSKNNVLSFYAADITSTGAPLAAEDLTNFSSLGWPQLLFDPPPSNLPLSH